MTENKDKTEAENKEKINNILLDVKINKALDDAILAAIIMFGVSFLNRSVMEEIKKNIKKDQKLKRNPSDRGKV